MAGNAPQSSRSGGLQPWLLGAAALVLAAGGAAPTLWARSTLSLAAHPSDGDMTQSGYTVLAVSYALVAAMLLGPAAWALLGGARRAGRSLAVAAPATTLALLPWTAATDAGAVLNLLAGFVAALAWIVAVRVSRP